MAMGAAPTVAQVSHISQKLRVRRASRTVKDGPGIATLAALPPAMGCRPKRVGSEMRTEANMPVAKAAAPKTKFMDR
ncbi:MAG: hypothetical protein BWY79_00365 [Actinobacteria bacterium ADurb.Bin444]|nr:MAG: hypothetical protein BWY79_00365 [Actinobacteria bacterium ADurb.Bin444]